MYVGFQPISTTATTSAPILAAYRVCLEHCGHLSTALLNRRAWNPAQNAVRPQSSRRSWPALSVLSDSQPACPLPSHNLHVFIIMLQHIFVQESAMLALALLKVLVEVKRHTHNHCTNSFTWGYVLLKGIKYNGDHENDKRGTIILIVVVVNCQLFNIIIRLLYCIELY